MFSTSSYQRKSGITSLANTSQRALLINLDNTRNGTHSSTMARISRGFAASTTLVYYHYKECDLKVDERIQIYQFIIHISPFFESFASNLRQSIRDMAAKEDLPSLDTIINNLLDESLAQKEAAAANFAKNSRNSGQNNQGQGQGRSGKWCSECKFSGHTNDDCYHLHPDLAPEGWKPRRSRALQNSQQGYNDQQGGGSMQSSGSRPQSNHSFHAESTAKDQLQTQTNHIFYAQGGVVATVSEASASALLASESEDSWVLDSGCSSHMTYNYAAMSNCVPINSIVQLGKGQVCAIVLGTIMLPTVTADGHRHLLTFTNVLYVPEIVVNLLSAETLRLKGLFYRNDQQVMFIKDGITMAELYVYNNLPHLRLKKQQQQMALTSSKVLSQSEGTPELWHLCTGQVYQASLIKAKANLTGMVIKGDPMVGSCNDCMKATSKHVISRVPSKRPEQPYTEVSTDFVIMSYEASNAYPPAEDASSEGDKIEEPAESNKQLVEHEELDGSILTLGSNTRPMPMQVPVPTAVPIAEPEKVCCSGHSNKGVSAVCFKQALIAITLPSKIYYTFTTTISISKTKTPNSYVEPMRSPQAAE